MRQARVEIEVTALGAEQGNDCMNPGIYRRCIRIATAENEARAELEDDLHRFAVIIVHDGVRVRAIHGLPIRVPWSLCPQAAAAFDDLVGMPLSAHPLAVFRHTDGSQQCTHMLDLAGLAIAHAARGTRLRQYDVEAPYVEERGRAAWRCGATARRRANPALDHDGATQLAPQAFAGRDIKRLPPWAGSAFPDPDDYEAIILLR
jgi:hypothetical protein